MCPIASKPVIQLVAELLQSQWKPRGKDWIVKTVRDFKPMATQKTIVEAIRQLVKRGMITFDGEKYIFSANKTWLDNLHSHTHILC